MEPGGFGLLEDEPQANHTVFIRCASDELENLSHKPHYPDSVFHVTLYDGKSLEFAQALLLILEGFEWRFKAPLPENTILTNIQIKSSRRKKEAILRKYNAKLKKLFWDITGLKLSAQLLTTLPAENRLEIAREICKYLHEIITPSQKIPGKKLPDLMVSQPASSVSLTPALNTKWTGDINRGIANQIGLYLTPPELAKEIVEYVMSLFESPMPEIHFGDPAVGTGVFFSALCQALSHEKIVSAIGIELDQKRAAATHNRWAHKGLKVIRGDYLHMERLPPRTLIFANPPYVRYQHLEPHYGQKLRQRASVNMGMQINGQSGLYVYFLLLSHAWMAENAIAAWLVPSEFMDTKYGVAIRQYLTQKVELIRIHRFNPSDVQFENALVSSAVVVFRNRLPVKRNTALFTTGGSMKTPEKFEQIPVEELQQENKWTISRDCRLSKPPSKLRIGDLFTVSRGVATGANNFFIMERAVAAHNGIPGIALRPVVPKARTLKSDVIERDLDGYPLVSPQLCLLDCSLQESEIRSKFPRFMEYLETAEGLGVRGRTLVKGRKPWYRQEKREPALFLCTYMGRGGRDSLPIRFIWNKSDAIATNVYLMLYPRKKLADLLLNRPSLQEDIFSLLQQTAKLGFSQYGRVYGGDLRKIEPRELLGVPLAFFPDWLEQVIDERLF